MALAAKLRALGRNGMARIRVPWPRRPAAAGPSEADPPEIDLDEAEGDGRRGRRFVAAMLVPALLVGGIVVWLSVTADQTVEELTARVPQVVVPVAGRPPPALNAPDAEVALAAAPVPELVEEAPAGPLPRVAADGRTPWQTYARPFAQEDTRPRIALVVAEMGLSASRTTEAIRTLPGPVTLAFPPQAPRLADWVAQARQAGHEVLLDLPMEPAGYPEDDPGPNSLLTRLGDAENRERLHRALAQATGYVGVTSLSGSRFTAEPDSLRPVLAEVTERGLMLLDARAGARSRASTLAAELGLPQAASDSLVDRTPAPAAIDAELAALEDIARNRGAAIGVLSSYPVTFQRLQAWLPTLEEKGLVLAPITAVVNRQPDR